MFTDQLEFQGAGGRSDRQRAKILDGARRAFGMQGFNKTSMVEIAEEAGVSRASLYQHFNSKEEIFRASVVAIHARSLRDAEAALKKEDLSLGDRVYGMIDARIGYFARVLDKSPHGQELERTSVDLTRDIIAGSTRDYVDLVTRLLQQANRAGEVNLKSAGLLGAGRRENLNQRGAGAKIQP